MARRCRPRESDDEKAVLLLEPRCFETVVEHGIVHTGEAAAALLHDAEGGEGLCDEGIARAGAIAAFAEFGQGERPRRIAGAANFDAVAEDAHEDLAGDVLVVAVGDGVDEGFAQGGSGVFIEAKVVEADGATGVKRVLVDEGERLFEGAGKGGINRALALGTSADAGLGVGLGEDLALPKAIGGALAEEEKGGGGEFKHPAVAIVYHQTAGLQNLPLFPLVRGRVHRDHEGGECKEAI